MSGLRFSRLISDGAILQRNKEIHVWGFAEKGAKIKVVLAPEKDNPEDLGEEADSTVSDEGRFDVFFDKRDAGGPYVITASDDNNKEKITAHDVYVGDVYFISGQSNMEFPMIRVKDTYPEEWEGFGDSFIRTFKIVEKGVFEGPIEDVETGEWLSFNSDTIDNYSAVGYFMAKTLRQKEDVPVGLLNISLGGAPLEAFLSREMLEGFDNAIAEADKYKNEKYRNEVLHLNDLNANRWHDNIDATDLGLQQSWEDGKKILDEGTKFMIPEFFSDTELGGFVGSVWFARTFDVPKEFAKKKAMVWFGTITDYDFCYVNGKLIGSTPYCYPPRRYEIPEGLLKEGPNTIVFRVCVEKGYGRITPGKLFGVIFGTGKRVTDGFNEKFVGADHIIELSGVWKYLKGCGIGATREIDPAEDTVFVNWKPTALFNGMVAPVTSFPVKAICFYQGESNCQRASEYQLLTKRHIEGYRKLWNDESLPYICVQLPRFNARIEECSYDGGKSWRELQNAQEKVTEIPGAYMVKAYEYGESNDLHPQRKEPIGRMLAEVILNEC